MPKRLLVLVIALVFVIAACSGGGKQASSCEEIATQTVDLIQELIDEVDSEFESMGLEEFIENGDSLPSIESFRKQSDAIEARSNELGCTTEEITARVAAEVGNLTARTQLGEFVITLLIRGNL